MRGRELKPKGTALASEFANEHDGRRYPIHHLDSTSITDDPDH